MSTAGPAIWITRPSAVAAGFVAIVSGVVVVVVAIGMFYSRAAAPLTISIISLVIEACRTRFMFSVSRSITSDAFELAASIAVILAACSAADDSSIARKICTSM